MVSLKDVAEVVTTQAAHNFAHDTKKGVTRTPQESATNTALGQFFDGAEDLNTVSARIFLYETYCAGYGAYTA